MHSRVVKYTSCAVEFADEKAQHDHELSLYADNEVLILDNLLTARCAMPKSVFGCSCDFWCDRVAIFLQP